MRTFLGFEYPLFVLPAGYDFLYTFIALAYHAVTLVFVFFPFVFVIKKWRPATWWKMAGATVATFLLHVFMMMVVSHNIGIWLDRYVQGGQYLSSPIDDPQFLWSWLVSLLLVFSPFFSVWAIYKKFTWLRFFIAFILAVILFALLAWYQLWIFLEGLREFYKYFN